MTTQELHKLWFTNQGGAPLRCKMADGAYGELIIGANGAEEFGFQLRQDTHIRWRKAAVIQQMANGDLQEIATRLPPPPSLNEEVDLTPTTQENIIL